MMLRLIIPALISSILISAQQFTQNTFVHNDLTIRPFNKELCLFKRYSSYVKNHDVWFTSCADADHTNANKAGKYHFSFDQETGLIYSEGSRVLNTGNPFCLKIANINRVYSQRVRIDRCDADNDLQKFTYLNGRLHSTAAMNLCANYSAFKKLCPAPKFGHFGGFWSEIFGQKNRFFKIAS